MENSETLDVLVDELKQRSPYVLTNDSLVANYKNLLSRGYHEFVINFTKDNFHKLMHDINSTQLLDALLVATVKTGDSDFIEILRYCSPKSEGAILLAKQIISGNIQLEEILRAAYDDLMGTKLSPKKWSAQLAKTIIEFCEIHCMDHKQYDSEKAKDLHLNIFNTERNLYISNINPVDYNGSTSRVHQICKDNNYGYLYTGKQEDRTGLVKNGVRTFGLTSIANYHARNGSKNVFNKRTLNKILAEEDFHYDLEATSFSTLSELCNNLVSKETISYYLKKGNIKNIIIGYLWNTFYLPKKLIKKLGISTKVDMHDYMSKRCDDLKIFSSPTFRISRDKEIDILNKFDQVICINNADELIVKNLVKSTAVIYPSFQVVNKRVENICQYDLLYIGGRQRANLDSIIWFMEEVIVNNNFTLSVAGSICEDQYLIDIINNNSKIHRCVSLLGKYNSLKEISAIAKIGIAPLRYGSGTKLKLLDYLALELPIIGTDIALYGFEGLNHEHGIFRANNANRFTDTIKSILDRKESSYHRSEIKNLLPNPKLIDLQ